jgi:hypothetical protein
MMVWYGFTLITGYEFGMIAWGVGIVTGVAATFGAIRKNGLLGVMSGAIAGLAIVGGQYLTFRSHLETALRQESEKAYERHLEFARKAANEKDLNTLRPLLAAWNAEDGRKPDLQSVTDEDIEDFLEEEQPFLEGLLAGKPSRKEYIEQAVRMIKAQIPISLALKESVSIWTALWLFLGVGTAWRIASGRSSADEEETPRHRRRRHAVREPHAGGPPPSGQVLPPDGSGGPDHDAARPQTNR